MGAGDRRRKMVSVVEERGRGEKENFGSEVGGEIEARGEVGEVRSSGREEMFREEIDEERGDRGGGDESEQEEK